MVDTGSIATRVYNRVSPMPVGVSGELLQIVEEEKSFVEEYTGVSISSDDVPVKYQGVIADLATAEVAGYLNVNGSQGKNIRLGDFNVSDAGEARRTGQFFREKAMSKLKVLGRKLNFRRVIS